jgi:hypothetical protein
VSQVAMLVGALFIIVTSRSSAAQQPTVHVGDRARLTIAGRAESVVVDLLALSVDSVWFFGGSQTYERSVVSRQEITRVEVQHVADANKHTAIGVAVGGVLGSVLWVAHARGGACTDGPCGAGIIFTPVAAVAGGVLGAVAGRLSARDSWTTAALAAQ